MKEKVKQCVLGEKARREQIWIRNSIILYMKEVASQHPMLCPICTACTVDGEKETGSGARKKDSKRRAAELLLRKLKAKSQPCQVADVNKDKSQPFQAVDGI
jgi:hypothetical protein